MSKQLEYREPYPTWIVAGMDILAAGILVASFRDAWTVVQSLGAHANDWTNSLVAAAVVFAIDASILLLEQARSQVKLRGGATIWSDAWVAVLILISAMLNVRYLTTATETSIMMDQIIGAILGVAIPSTIAVLGYIKGDMLAYNARLRQPTRPTQPMPVETTSLDDSAAPAPSEQSPESPVPIFRIRRSA